jgi:hypothetical protein
MGISDSRSVQFSGYVFPSTAFDSAGLPGSSTVLSAHAVPFHPEEPGGCFFFSSFLHHQHWASSDSEDWPLSSLNVSRGRFGFAFATAYAFVSRGFAGWNYFLLRSFDYMYYE